MSSTGSTVCMHSFSCLTHSSQSTGDTVGFSIMHTSDKGWGRVGLGGAVCSRQICGSEEKTPLSSPISV